jgi:hypothetical protein
LKKVFGYAATLSKPNSKPYSVTKVQQEPLNNQIDSDKSKYSLVESLYSDLKSKNELLIIVSPIASKNITAAVEYKRTKKVALDFLQDYEKTYKSLEINPFYASKK